MNAPKFEPALERLPVSRPNAVGIMAALCAFDQPAFLVVSGAVVYANPAAMGGYPEPPGWLCQADTNPTAIEQRAKVTRLDIDGTAAVLVIPHSAHPGCSGFDRLTPPLRQIAQLLAEGWSDKEIAAKSGRPLPTVRTYAVRAMARLGVQSRGQLARLRRSA